MSPMKFTVQHDRGLDEAKQILAKTVDDVQKHFGMLVNGVEWNDAKTDVTIDAKGADVRAWVDAVDVHLICDVPLMNKLMGGPLVERLRGVIEDRFQKKLTEDPSS